MNKNIIGHGHNFSLQSIQFVRDRSWLKYYVTGFDRYHIVHEVI
jgi:hypothetical protein